jgi:hypothetical protein
MFPFDKSTKPGKGNPPTVYNFVIALFVGTFGCEFGKNLLRADKRFASHIFSVVAFLEKNTKNMIGYKKDVEKLGVKKWDSFKPLFFEILGYIEEFGKDLQNTISELPIWSKKTNDAAYAITKFDSTFGKSSVLLATVTVGGHFGVLLDLVRLMIAYHDRLQYRIGVMIVPEDEQSTTIFQGVMWFLQHFKIFDAVIIWNNNNRSHPNSSPEIQDILVSIGLVVLLHRDAKRQPDVSAFDFVNSICKHGDGRTHFYGVSAKSTEIPRKPYKGLFTSKTRKDSASASMEITHTVNAVLHDKRYNITGFEPKKGASVHVGITGNLEWETEVLPGIKEWRGNGKVNLKFLRTNLEDGNRFPKIIAIALREIEPPKFECNQEFQEFLQEYFRGIETTEEKFREDYGCPELEEIPETEKVDETEKPDSTVAISNREGEEDKP